MALVPPLIPRTALPRALSSYIWIHPPTFPAWMLAGACRYDATSPVPTPTPHDHGDMPKYFPAGLTQYVLNNFSKKSPPCHVTQDDVSTPLERLEVEKITRYQSVRGRGGVIAVMHETC